MTNPMITEHNSETNEITVRPMTDAELIHNTEIKNQIETEKTTSALKASAIAKLVSGNPLSEDEAKTIVI